MIVAVVAVYGEDVSWFGDVKLVVCTNALYAMVGTLATVAVASTDGDDEYVSSSFSATRSPESGSVTDRTSGVGSG